ncbi:MAG: phosphatase PAP2 family protein [Bacteroidetes bacterium]|nr:phosphatase PAP2 family protein [Bacteroidota bacterium]
MIEWLYGIDVALFRLGNETIANPAGDWFFPFITNLKNFMVPYALLILGLLIFGKKRGAITVLLLVVTITLADQISSFVIKPWVGRVRPCHVLENVRLLVGCGSGKSFTSSHATNNFAMAVLISHFYPVARPWLLLWASLVAFSRVYIGVHYPSDILGGAVLGTLIALAVIQLWEQGRKQVHAYRHRRTISQPMKS